MIAKFTPLRLFIIFVTFFTICISLGFGRVDAAASGSLNTVCNDSNLSAGSAGSSAFCKDKSTNSPVRVVLHDAINIITAIAGFVAVIMIVVSGLQMVSSNGNPEKISTARNTIIYACIGLVVIALARIIIGFIINRVS
jgi:hypothetical protein